MRAGSIPIQDKKRMCIICTKLLTKTVSNAGLSLPLPDGMSIAKTVTAIAESVASIAKA